MLVKVKKLHTLATFEKAHEEDIGFDLTCCGWEVVDSIARLKLGIATEPSDGWYFLLVPRSSFPKLGYTQANCVGVVDPEYRGEWMMNIMPIQLYQTSSLIPYGRDDIQTRFVGKKVAQAIPQRVIKSNVSWVEEVNSTERGTKGFGSTDQLPIEFE